MVTSFRRGRCPLQASRAASRVHDVGDPIMTITAADMDRMSPRERADAVDASQVNDLGEVDPAFRDEVLETARQLGAQRRSDA